MSSTGRGPRVGGPEDFFRTPGWAVRRRLDLGDLPGGIWLEPGAGDGAIIRAVNAVRSDVQWIAVEIREEAIAALEKIPNVTVLRGDFLAESTRVLLNLKAPIVVSLGNPPYEYAQAFIDQARLVAPRASVLNLLRTNFTGSEERADFMRRFAPDVAQLPNRPSFYLRQTDSIEYSWMTWHPGERRVGRFEVLASTPIKERQLDMPPVAACPPCRGLGWWTADGRAVKKKDPSADRPCRGCLGFGKIETGLPPSMNSPMEGGAGSNGGEPKMPAPPLAPTNEPGFDGSNGGHKYDTNGTSDCAFGCGAWAGGFSSGAPDGIDPLGICPNNPGGTT